MSIAIEKTELKRSLGVQTRAFASNNKNQKDTNLRFKTTNRENRKESLLQVGQVLDVTVNAIGYKNRGIAELSSGYTIFIPNTQLEDKVRIKIIKIDPTKPKFAIGKLQEIVTKSKKEVPVKVGEILEFTLAALGSSGIVQLPGGYTLFIPNTKLNEKTFQLLDKSQAIKIQITRVKSKYAFATRLTSFLFTGSKTINESAFHNNGLIVGRKFQLILPKRGLQSMSVAIREHKNATLLSSFKQSFRKESQVGLKGQALSNSRSNGRSGMNSQKERSLVTPVSNNYILTKLNNSTLFLKLNLGCKLGDKVQIQITKVEKTFAVAQVLQISPLSRAKKHLNVKHTIKHMLKNGMHFGEKTIKCHANMKKYVWLRKKGQNKNRPLVKKGRYLLNLLKTRRCLIQSLKQLAKYAAKGRTFLFVGTKKPATGLIARAALLTKNSFFVNQRWLGGMLTNWKTILKSISKIKPILKEKQKMIKSIREKRQDIKKQLFEKVNKLRKKSRKLIQKGQLLITKVKTDKPRLIEISQILIQKRTSFLKKNRLLLEKYKILEKQKKSLLEKSLLFKQKGNTVLSRKKLLISQLIMYRKKLKELNLLLHLSKELKNFKNETAKKGNDIWSISYGQFSNIVTKNDLNFEGKPVFLPNPPKPVLNKIINLIRQKSDSRLFANLTSNFPKQSNQSLAMIGFTKLGQKGYNANVKSESLETTNKVVLLSKLLNKFSRFIPFIKTYKDILVLRIKNIQTLLINLQPTVEILQKKATFLLKLQNQISSELFLVKSKLISEKKLIKVLKKKFKKLASEQRLLDFLPKLRYLPTPKSKMKETIQILMKKFVDPKMRYPLDKIYDEKLKFSSKKIAATRKKKWQRLEKYFGGVTKMAKMKKKEISKNVAIIIGQKEEMNAVYECKKLGIKMFHIVDTNCNPRLADYLVPANDDSRNSIKFVLGKVLTNLKLAEKLRTKLSGAKVF